MCECAHSQGIHVVLFLFMVMLLKISEERDKLAIFFHFVFQLIMEELIILQLTCQSFKTLMEGSKELLITFKVSYQSSEFLVISPKCTKRRNGQYIRYTNSCGPHAAIPDKYVGSPLGSGIGVDAGYIFMVTLAEDSKSMKYATLLLSIYRRLSWWYISVCFLLLP